MMSGNSSENIVIVGGGPIGLAHALAIKTVNPNLNVIVCEKYATYQRAHTLNMRHESLEVYLKAAGLEKNEELKKLVKRLKNDPMIRTNELEGILKQLAIANGVEIKQENITREDIHTQLEKYKPNLIIGADGTHSTVSDTYFPEGNQEKKEFDFVLQCRFEIAGRKKATPVKKVAFTQLILGMGTIGSQVFGAYDETTKTTPVVMQMMVTKKEFDALKAHATSKNPIRVLQNQDTDKSINNMTWEEVPETVKAFLSNYLALQINESAKHHERIVGSSVRLSVNEAPATFAKQVININKQNVPVILVGDAALGLSYFKGLNAGLENAGKFVSSIKPFLLSGIGTFTSSLQGALEDYQTWFLKIFAPQKIASVKEYSDKNIRLVEEVARTYKRSKMSVANDHRQDYVRMVSETLAYNAIDDYRGRSLFFPHREHDFIKSGQFAYIPVTYTLKQIGKLFTSYATPYKTDNNFYNDLRQPLTGVINLVTGIIRIGYGIVNLDGKAFADGCMRIVRGVFEVALTPFAWTIKIFLRSTLTALMGPTLIEENDGVTNLVKKGQSMLRVLESISADQPLPDKEKYEATAIICDLDRKLRKQSGLGQHTSIDLSEASRVLEALSTKDKATFVQMNKEYLALFANQAVAKLPASGNDDDNDNDNNNNARLVK